MSGYVTLSSCTVPCQNVLDYFKTVLEFHNQLVQPMPEEQLTEVRRQAPVHYSQLFMHYETHPLC